MKKNKSKRSYIAVKTNELSVKEGGLDALGNSVFELTSNKQSLDIFLHAAILDKNVTKEQLLFQAADDLNRSLRDVLIGAFIKVSLEEFLKEHEQNPKQAEKKLGQKLKRASTKIKKSKAL